MRLRSKILILLFCVAAIPTLITGALGFLSLINLGEQLASETSQALLADAEVRMEEIAYENGQFIGRATDQLEMAVRVQQVAALHAFTTSAPESTQIVLSTDFDVQPDLFPSMEQLEMFSSVLEDGSVLEKPVSYETQAISVPRGLPEEIAIRQSKQLMQLNETYQALVISPGVPALHFFTASADGVIGIYPGHGGMPTTYNATERAWFTLAQQSDGRVMHTRPSVDASTNRIVIASVAPVIDGNGTFLGVTGVERSVVDALHAIHIPEEWNESATIRVVIPAGNKLAIIASQAMEDGSIEWSDLPETSYLFDESTAFATLVDEIKKGQSGCLDLHNEGVDMMAAYAPIGGMAGALVIWVPHNIIAAEAISEEELIRKEMNGHASAMSTVALVIILIVILVALFISKIVSKPIVALSNATTSISLGNFDVSVKNSGKDEIGELTRNFNFMVPQLKERLEMQETLEVAKQIQQCLLPSENPTFAGWDIAGKCMYCDATGGDYYDFIQATDDDKNLRLVLGDVTGHGIAAALMMATARSLLRGGVRCGDDPVQRLYDVNNSLVKDTPLGWFMTFYCLELSADSSEIRWISAGHDAAIVVAVDGSVSEFEGDDIPLGVNENWAFTGKGPATIAHGSVIVLGTDGIWEARNTKGEMYDKPRLIEVIQKNRTRAVEDICDAIVDAVLEFCGDAPRTDDITMIVARRS